MLRSMGARRGLPIILLLMSACTHQPSWKSDQPIGWSKPAPPQTADAGTAAAPDAAEASGADAAKAGTTPHFQPAQPLGCEPVAGSVKFFLVGVPPACRSLHGGDAETAPGVAGAPTGIAVADSAEGFRRGFGCDPPAGVDFSAQRLVAYSFVHDSNRTYSLAGVVREDGELHLVFDIDTLCQGRRPTAYRTVKLIAVPSGGEPVQIAFCNKPRHCGPVP